MLIELMEADFERNKYGENLNGKKEARNMRTKASISKVLLKEWCGT